MDLPLDAKVLISASSNGIKTMEQAAIFLSAAESPEEWHLRVKYIAEWTCGTPGVISKEVWDYVSTHDWVVTTGMVLGVTGQSTPGIVSGVKVEHIEI